MTMKANTNKILFTFEVIIYLHTLQYVYYVSVQLKTVIWKAVGKMYHRRLL